MADFDGYTYEPEHDKERLTKQLEAVKRVLMDGMWWIPANLELETGYNWASISARIRDLRKEKFGGYHVERMRLGGGIHAYRLAIPREPRQLSLV